MKSLFLTPLLLAIASPLWAQPIKWVQRVETPRDSNGYSWEGSPWTMTSVNTWGRYKLEQACNL